MNDYPTEEELGKVRTWDIGRDGAEGLVEFIRSIWWEPDWGFNLYWGKDSLLKKRIRKLQLHTAGWSGNEDIIAELKQNRLFWALTWVESWQGGHYLFEFTPSLWIGKAERNSSKKKVEKTERDYYKVKETTA